jgi:hypothetical protein
MNQRWIELIHAIATLLKEVHDTFDLFRVGFLYGLIPRRLVEALTIGMITKGRIAVLTLRAPLKLKQAMRWPVAQDEPTAASTS